jgi:hypothetical protein
VIIVGAGLAGLIAGHVFPNAVIIERQPEPSSAHRALLRFRSDVISNITGVPFRKVRVHKGVWYEGEHHHAVNVRMANEYSRKVMGGRVLTRSIWDLSSVDRWVAPEDFHARLVEACKARIDWGIDAKPAVLRGASDEPIVSTMPMPEALALWYFDQPRNIDLFKRAPIAVRRWRIPGADVHQTVYFPSNATSTYRVSITGDIMIAESMDEEHAVHEDEVREVFGLEALDLEELGTVEQRYGKIVPIDNRVRREFIHNLSRDIGIYSVGRFATWRNILLDDVAKDLRIVKEMIEQQDTYANRLRSL